MSINYSERIPNNVDLSGDRRLQRALESWQPSFLSWWRELGPEGTEEEPTGHRRGHQPAVQVQD